MSIPSIGVVRQVDDLGRIVLPKELRDMLGIGVSEGLEFFNDDKTIMLKQYTPACIFCNNAEGLVYFKNRGICKNCLDESKNAQQAKDA